MKHFDSDALQFSDIPKLPESTLVLAFSGWMDGGSVSTGTVKRLVDLLSAEPVATIDAEPFYVYNLPGPMEVSAMFRPHVEIEDGLVRKLEFPSNTFYCHPRANVFLFVGREPHLNWRAFGDCVLRFCEQAGIRRIVFVGSFGGTVPHTREPRLFVTCSDARLLPEMEQYGMRRTGYSGPGSFISYLMTRAPAASLDMTSLVAEIPGYLEGINPASIEAVTRRLAKILQLPLDLNELRTVSTEWELQVSSAVDDDAQLAQRIRQLEEAYDNELLEHIEDVE